MLRIFAFFDCVNFVKMGDTQFMGELPKTRLSKPADLARGPLGFISSKGARKFDRCEGRTFGPISIAEITRKKT